MIDIGISAEQGRELGIDDPGNFRLRVRVRDERDRGQGVDDVAERARFDDQNRFQIADFKLQIEKERRERLSSLTIDNWQSVICNYLASEREPLG